MNPAGGYWASAIPWSEPYLVSEKLSWQSKFGVHYPILPYRASIKRTEHECNLVKLLPVLQSTHRQHSWALWAEHTAVNPWRVFPVWSKQLFTIFSNVKEHTVHSGGIDKVKIIKQNVHFEEVLALLASGSSSLWKKKGWKIGSNQCLAKHHPVKLMIPAKCSSCYERILWKVLVSSLNFI